MGIAISSLLIFIEISQCDNDGSSSKEEEHEQDIKAAIMSFGKTDVEEAKSEVAAVEGKNETKKEEAAVKKEDVHCSHPRLYVQYEEDIWFCEGKTPEISVHYFNQNPKRMPVVMLEKDAHFGKFYSLVMLDPDAPSSSNPANKNWIHWGVMNIPGRVFIHGAFDPSDCTMFEEFVKYAPPTPGKGTGKHRYSVIAYEQEDFMYLVHGHNPHLFGRAKFNLDLFTQSNDLSQIANATFTCDN